MLLLLKILISYLMEHHSYSYSLFSIGWKSENHKFPNCTEQSQSLETTTNILKLFCSSVKNNALLFLNESSKLLSQWRFSLILPKGYWKSPEPDLPTRKYFVLMVSLMFLGRTVTDLLLSFSVSYRVWHSSQECFHFTYIISGNFIVWQDLTHRKLCEG